MDNKVFRFYLPFIFVFLFVALWTSLERLSWALPESPGGAAQHGALMVVAFLGALIFLERAAALKQRWTHLSPILVTIGMILFCVPSLFRTASVIVIMGSLLAVVVMFFLTYQQNMIFNQVMALASILFLVGNVLWALGKPLPIVVFFWASYLLLTIFGERLELTRMMPTPKLDMLIIKILILLFAFANFAVLIDLWIGARAYAVLLFLITLWFIKNDIARRTITLSGQPKFTAIGLFLGYFWSLIGSSFVIYFGYQPSGLFYDAFLHSMFLGFAFSMIFVHAPIVFPAVFSIKLPFTNRFYIHLILLSITLAGRIGADLLNNPLWRKWFGLFNVIVITMFLMNTTLSVYQAYKKTPAKSS